MLHALRPWRAHSKQLTELRGCIQRKGAKSVAHALDPESHQVEVCIVDPRQVLNQDFVPSGLSQEAVQICVPSSFLPEIAKGAFELGDADEPTSHFAFGKQAEIFQLQFIGKCRCPSGYVGVIASSFLEGRSGTASWETFKDRVNDESMSFPDEQSGFLFAGPVVQAETVSVYKFEELGTVSGLLVASDAEELD